MIQKHELITSLIASGFLFASGLSLIFSKTNLLVNLGWIFSMGAIVLIAFQLFQYWYNRPRLIGIRKKCCTMKNVEFYSTTDNGNFYQCKTCLRLFKIKKVDP